MERAPLENENRTKCQLGCGANECRLRKLGILTGVAAELVPHDDARAIDVIEAHHDLKLLCRDYSIHDILANLEESS